MTNLIIIILAIFVVIAASMYVITYIQKQEVKQENDDLQYEVDSLKKEVQTFNKNVEVLKGELVRLAKQNNEYKESYKYELEKNNSFANQMKALRRINRNLTKKLKGSK